MDRRSALKVIGAGGCGLACWGGIAHLLKGVEAQAAPRTGKVDYPLAFFDVDSRELNAAGTGLGFRPRVEPVAAQLNRLYEVSDKQNIPLVFTVCCSGRMLEPRSMADVLVVPLDGADRKWEEKRAHYHLINMEKKTYKEPKTNFACAAYNMFKDNGNAANLVKSMNVGEWVVFGNGFDLCVNAAVCGLLANEQKVRLISDIYIPTAKGYSVPGADGKKYDLGTPENHERILAEFKQHGVRIETLEQFLASVA